MDAQNSVADSAQSQWTAEELAEFTDLVDATGSRSQTERIRARLGMPPFIEKHGKDKCDAMFVFICQRDGVDSPAHGPKP